MTSKCFTICWVCMLAVTVVGGCWHSGDFSPTADENEASVPETTDDASLLAANHDLEPAPPNDSGNNTHSTSPDINSHTVKSVVLSEQEPMEQHFPDGSLKARWHLRLYVTFNRALPLYQQEVGSYEFHGPYEEYYPGGKQLFMKGNYVDGVRDGVWNFWHPNGAKAKAGRYADGKLEGQWHVWREDGTLLRTESYQDDRMTNDK